MAISSHQCQSTEGISKPLDSIRENHLLNVSFFVIRHLPSKVMREGMMPNTLYWLFNQYQLLVHLTFYVPLLTTVHFVL